MTKPRRAQRELPFTTDVPDGVELSSHDIFIWFLSLASLHDSVRAHQLLTSPTCESKRVAVSRCARESSSRIGKTLYFILFLERERESERARLWTSYLSRAPPPLAPAASPTPSPLSPQHGFGLDCGLRRQRLRLAGCGGATQRLLEQHQPQVNILFSFALFCMTLWFVTRICGEGRKEVTGWGGGGLIHGIAHTLNGNVFSLVIDSFIVIHACHAYAARLRVFGWR